MAFIALAASITSAALQPLSSAPVPSSHESRWAARITTSSGFSRPRISPTTFSCSIGPPTLFGMLNRARTCPGCAATARARRIASSRATTACGILSICPTSEFVCRYINSRSRALVQRIALAPLCTARAMIAGGRKYSSKRSAHVEPISECASKSAPLIFPARANSCSLPLPMSTIGTSIPPAGIAGDHPVLTTCTGNCADPINSSRVSPSLQVTGNVYFSV